MSDILERNGGYGGPDPSALTSQLVMRELTGLRELLESRLTAMDKAQTLFHDDLVRIPTSVDRSVANLKELHEKIFLEKFGTIEERFHGIQIQFTERDTRTEQIARGNELALTAALAAAKEAVGAANTSSALAIAKSESGMTKQLDQLVLLIQTSMGGVDSKVNDLKDRLTLIEGKTVGQAAHYTSSQTSNRDTMALVALGLTLLGIIAMVVMNLIKK